MPEEVLENNEWSNVWLMFEDIREYARHNGRLIIIDLTTPKLGWRCALTGKQWQISLTNLKLTLGEGYLANMVREFLQNQDGKYVLTAYLNSSQY